ncbi:Threonine synthase [Ewingella americana]|uniref:Threonine synthase n=1 Tax=Ewingella americana TaxID=41202 RepID=A0A377NJX6_9GAMM|nr:Threonine synthase [Ewingella americana]
MKLYNLKDHNEQVSFAQAVKQGLGKQQGCSSLSNCLSLR